MKIKNISTGELRIALKTPFKTALRTVAAVGDVAVRVETDDGLVGYGEAAPTAAITGDTKGGILSAMHEYISPAIVGRDMSDFEDIECALHRSCVHNTSAKAAVDMALYSLRAQSLGVPLWRLLGGAKDRLETDVTISVNAVGEMVADSLRAVADGFNILKVKVGLGGEGDAHAIKAVREAVGPDVVLRVDANQGWGAKQAVMTIRLMEDMGLGIELVEQPVPAGDVAALAFVTSRVSTPILADESVFSPLDAAHICESKAADMINIKLMKCGGIYQALKIASIAQSYGVPCMMGCMLEGKLGVAAAAHVACGLGAITLYDLDGPSLCAEDPFAGGPVFDGATIQMVGDIGVGVTPTRVDW